jgi:hypothetical protein
VGGAWRLQPAAWAAPLLTSRCLLASLLPEPVPFCLPACWPALRAALHCWSALKKCLTLPLSSFTPQSYFAAAQLSTHSSGAGLCGRCLTAFCSDAAACPAGRSVLVQVLDDCGDCGGSGILLSSAAFRCC